MTKNRSVRIFLFSMMVTLYLLLLFVGVVIVEYNTRSVGFGDAVPVIAYNRADSCLEVCIFGDEWHMDLSNTDIQFVGLETFCNLLDEIEKHL